MRIGSSVPKGIVEVKEEGFVAYHTRMTKYFEMLQKAFGSLIFRIRFLSSPLVSSYEAVGWLVSSLAFLLMREIVLQERISTVVK